MATLSASLRLILGLTYALLLASCATVPEADKGTVQDAATPGKTPTSVVAPPVKKTTPIKQPPLTQAVPTITKVEKIEKPQKVKIPTLKPVIKPLVAKKITPIKAAPKKVAPPSMPAGRVTGRVVIAGRGTKTYSPADVIVTLTPINAKLNVKAKNMQHKIVTRNKTYNPAVMTILKGDTLNFQNRDQIKHNVFSSSKDNIFDLGTYGKGRNRSITMNTPGIVKVYCNIHAEMATFVMVAENELNAITDKSGTFAISNVPPGEYKLSLWHIRGSLERTIVVSSDDTKALALTLSTATYKPADHKNKFGKNYKKKPALFEDEFY